MATGSATLVAAARGPGDPGGARPVDFEPAAADTSASMHPDHSTVGARRRWPRGQKFSLSAAGEAADQLHRDTVNGARSSGRSSLDAALAAWAAPFGVQPGDGLLLSELRGQRRGLNDLVEALETSGIEPSEVKSSIDRLVQAGLAEPAPVAPDHGT
jgi:hypothetical protein